jgi:hypothetical protein
VYPPQPAGYVMQILQEFALVFVVFAPRSKTAKAEPSILFGIAEYNYCDIF